MQKEIECSNGVSEELNYGVISEEDIELKEVRCEDMYTIGQACIAILRALVITAKVCFIPSVHAAPPKPPERPKPMRYKELPIYESPHYEYKDYEADKLKCPKASHKIIHSFLYPHVSAYRKQVGCSLHCAKNELVDTYKEVTTDFGKAQNRFKAYMRDPANDTLRICTMAFGTVAGLYFGRGGGIPRKLFFCSAGVLAAGSLCYPKETDEVFREVLYHVGKSFITIYNSYCGKNFVMRERVPCKKDLVQVPPPSKQKTICPPKK